MELIYTDRFRPFIVTIRCLFAGGFLILPCKARDLLPALLPLEARLLEEIILALVPVGNLRRGF